jgi:acylphosphatase
MLKVAMKRIIANVKGRVQGVGYRYFVTDGAQQHDLKGYVRNMPDGSVQVIAEGNEESLLKFVRYLHAEGDPVIHVSHLEVEWDIPTGEFSGFGIRR